MKLAKVRVCPRNLLIGCKLAENLMGDSRALGGCVGIAVVRVSPRRLLTGCKLAENLMGDSRALVDGARPRRLMYE